MYTDETILSEMISFLKYRGLNMSNPYVICGERFVDMLSEHYTNENMNFEITNALNGNYMFVVITK